MRRAAAYLALVALAAVFLAPVGIMIVGSLKPDERVLVEAGDARAFWPGEASLENYGEVFARVPFGRFLVNSLVINVAIVALGLVVNSLAGYALARMRWRGRGVALLVVAALMIIPLEAIAVPLFYLVTVAGWRDTYAAQIVPFLANAFSIHLFHVYFRDMPRELEESARIDGAGPLTTFVRVVAPNAKPAFASVAILTFLTQWGAFLWPLMVTSGPRVRPLPLAIASFFTLPPLHWGEIFAFGGMMVAPILVVFLFFQRWFVRGLTSTGIKG